MSRKSDLILDVICLLIFSTFCVLERIRKGCMISIYEFRNNSPYCLSSKRQKVKTKFRKKENFINYEYFGGSDVTNVS